MFSGPFHSSIVKSNFVFPRHSAPLHSLLVMLSESKTPIVRFHQNWNQRSNSQEVSPLLYDHLSHRGDRCCLQNGTWRRIFATEITVPRDATLERRSAATLFLVFLSFAGTTLYPKKMACRAGQGLSFTYSTQNAEHQHLDSKKCVVPSETVST